MAHTYRIGIDVGGTFTDAVLLIDGTLELVGTVKVPTTHSSPFGVAEGISNALESLLQTYQIPSGAISFIAHGTTQATNALLEGDVAPVAIIATGDGAFSYKVRKETQFSSFPLADKKELKSSSYFLSSFNKEEVDKIIDNIIEKKIVTVVSATAYSVDTPFIEKAIKKMVSKKGLACTATHEMSGLYGLRTRTKTAVLNASILPKMVETTEFMKKSVISSGIHSPLMIMRSDGGVMSAAEVAHTPIQTILSGPAAGVRGAISYLDVQEGFFMEAGGTSTDISLIRNNDVLVRWAQIGSHKTYINSLDIHTVAVAGGSMLQRSGDTIKVGPRSAHIAGLEYLCFAENLDVDSLDIEEYISKNDVSPYITCVDRTTQKRYALTLTCIANVMGYTTKDDYCYSPHYERIMFVIKLLASFLGISADQVLQKVNDSVCSTIIPVLEELATTYQVDINNLPIVGGGGGCSSVVPLVAKIKNMKYLIGKNAHVISPIGVALSMVRESV
ncbi:MAG: hydantoinase/oxoprolinase family protein, partial [Spirochaetia bacterium]|nr:hydantoinase/oxoprolinase family protein [Spirochaetia bacterium]